MTPGDGALAVSWTAPVYDGGSRVTSYTAWVSPGDIECSTQGLTCVIDGLESGQSYAVRVAATNSAGTSAPSATTTGVPGSRPNPPTSVTARAGVNQAKVIWAPPTSDGGSPVTSYTAASTPAGLSCTTAASARSCYVTGLSNGAAYTFMVTATTAIGTSVASAASGEVIPTQDTQTPMLVSAVVTPARVSSVGGSVTVQLHITDDVSGRRTPSGSLDANPAVLFDRGAGTTSIGFTRAVNRVSATSTTASTVRQSRSRRESPRDLVPACLPNRGQQREQHVVHAHARLRRRRSGSTHGRCRDG